MRTRHLRVTALFALFVCAGPVALGDRAIEPVGPDRSPAGVRRLLAADDWQAGLGLARSLAEHDPADAAIAAALGQALFRAGRLSEVEAALEPALDASTVPLFALVTLARLRHAEGRTARAAELIEAALDRAPDDRDVLYQASEIVGDRRRALELLGRYLEHADGDDSERVEAAEGARRVFEALGDTRIWFDRARPESLELPLRRLWDPATGTVQGYVVQARIGTARRAVRLLLDSGSPGLYLIERSARRRGFEPLAQRTVFGGGGDGRHQTHRGFFPTFRLGGLSFGNALATSTPDELDPIGRYHGLLGFGIFGGYRVRLDLNRGRLELLPSTAASGDEAGSPYWTVGGQMLVEVEVGAGGAAPVPALFLLDTGATRTLVSLELAARLGVATGREIELYGFGGRRSARALDGVTVSFAGQRTVNGSTRAVDLSRRSRLGGIEVSGFLGLDLLDGRVVTIDGPRRRVGVTAAPSGRSRRRGD